MNKKYVLTTEVNERGLHRIVALRDIPRYGVKAGDFGGFVESEKNLSQDGDAWVANDAQVYKSAYISENACVSGHAHASGCACIFGNAHVFGNAKVCSFASIFDNAKIYGDACVSGHAYAYENALICCNACVSGDARIYGNAHVSGYAKVYGNTRVSGNDFIYKDVYDGTIFENNKTCEDSPTYCCCPFSEATNPVNKILLQILALNSEDKTKLHNLLHKIS